MAKSSGIGELIGWGIAGLGVWWLGSANNWFGLFGGTSTVASTAPVTSTPAAVTAAPTPAASVALAGPVTTSANGSLKANVSINGTIQNLAVIPGGGAYNTSGQDQTSALALLGVTPAQIYSLMQAAYATQQAATASTPATSSTPTSSTAPRTGPFNFGTTGAAVNAAHAASAANQPLGRRGVGAMVGSTRINYRRKSRFA
jgi:hypothetical protein